MEINAESKTHEKVIEENTPLNETSDTTYGGILPSTEKLFHWTLLSLKFCLGIFATLAVLLERKFAIHMIVLFILSLGLLISLHIVWGPLLSKQQTADLSETKEK